MRCAAFKSEQPFSSDRPFSPFLLRVATVNRPHFEYESRLSWDDVSVEMRRRFGRRLNSGRFRMPVNGRTLREWQVAPRQPLVKWFLCCAAGQLVMHCLKFLQLWHGAGIISYPSCFPSSRRVSQYLGN
jgi:hypothetical protein